MNTITISFGVLPFAYVRVTKDAFPYPIAIFYTILPFTIVDFSVSPEVDAFTMSFAIEELAFIFVAIRVTLVALAVSDIILPKSFIDSALFVKHHTHPVSLSRCDLSTIDRI